MTVPFRVVFDTNVFTPENFHILENSPMINACKTKRIIPIYSHVFLEETFRAYGKENKRGDLLEKWLPFISKTVDRFCDDFNNIWRRELVEGCGLKTNIFMSTSSQAKLLSQISNIPLDGTWHAWNNSKSDRDIEDTKKLAQREISKSMRKEITEWKNAINYQPKKHGICHMNKFFEQEVDAAGKDFIVALIKCYKPMAVADRWIKYKEHYPYFTTFVINMLYIVYHAMTKSNSKIDLNAQADLNLMTHLLRADALVSNERGFLKEAF